MKWYRYEKIEFSKPTKYGIFLMLYVGICLTVFSIYNDLEIGETVKNNLKFNIELQASNIDKVIHSQVDAMKSFADFISKQMSINDAHILEVGESLSNNTMLTRIYTITLDGIAHVSDGSVFDASQRSYFQKSIKGETAIAEPMKSVIDGEDRIVVSVPIYQNNKIIGVVGGSLDIFSLREMIFVNEQTDSDSYTFIVNGNGDLISINDKEKASVSQNFFEFHEGSTFDGKPLSKAAENMIICQSECYLVDRDGDQRYLAIRTLEVNDWIVGYVVPVKTAHSEYRFIRMNEIFLFCFVGAGFVAYLLLVLRNIRKERKVLIQQASIDPLTSLLNKKSTEDYIGLKLDNLELKALLMIDIDDFKLINDTCGHDIGDLYLKKVAATLKYLFRKDDIIGRVGGDEMIVFMTGLTSREDVVHKVEDLLIMIKDITLEVKDLPKISCSVGIVFYPQDGENFEELYKKADVALYRAKNSGKDRYCIYKDII